jgi:hypothetical protein
MLLRRKDKEALAQLEPVVVMGRGHSGTRVLTWIIHHLGVTMGVAHTRETADVDDLVFSRKIKKIAIRNLGMTTDAEVSGYALYRFRRAARAYYQRLGRPASWGWKFPETYLVAPIVHRAFPRARYIHLVRDGRDVAFKNHLTDDPTRKLGRVLLRKIGAWGKPHHVQAAASWAAQIDWFDAYKGTLPRDRLLEMTFEALCRDPQRETRRVCDFLGLPLTDAAQDFIDRQINIAKLSQHREFDPAKVEEVTAEVRPVLERYGYVGGGRGPSPGGGDP